MFPSVTIVCWLEKGEQTEDLGLARYFVSILVAAHGFTLPLGMELTVGRQSEGRGTDIKETYFVRIDIAQRACTGYYGIHSSVLRVRLVRNIGDL